LAIIEEERGVVLDYIQIRAGFAQVCGLTAVAGGFHFFAF
jgi:hypothetical protein